MQDDSMDIDPSQIYKTYDKEVQKMLKSISLKKVTFKRKISIEQRSRQLYYTPQEGFKKKILNDTSLNGTLSQRINEKNTDKRASFLENINKESRVNVKDFLQIMQDRKQTFLKFSYKTTEILDSVTIQPFLKDLQGDICKGTMNVTELWGNKNIHQYSRYSKFSEAKRTLMRLGNKITIQGNSQNNGYSPRASSKTFTNKDECELKLKLVPSGSENAFQKGLRSKFSKQSSIMQKMMQNFVGPKSTQNLSNHEKVNKLFQINGDSIQQKHFLSSRLNISSYKINDQNQSNTQQLKTIITQIEDLQNDRSTDVKQLDHVIKKLSTQVMKYRFRQPITK